MFEIDLLQGQAVPMKSKPEGIAITAVTFAVPVIVAIVMFGVYLRNSAAMSVHERQIVNYQAKIDKLADAVEVQKAFEKEKSTINSSLTEVKSAIGRHMQWSPILVALVENMPDSVVLTNLEVKQHFARRKMPQKDDPQKMVDVSVPVRTLKMNIRGAPQSNNDRAIKDFRDSLRSSAVIGPKLEDIRVSQEVVKFQDRDVVSYEIKCVFKP